MKRLFLILFFIPLLVPVTAQTLDYKIMLAGSLKIEDDDDRNLDGLSLILWVATESIGKYNRDLKTLKEEQSKQDSDPNKIYELKDDIKKWQEMHNEHIIGKEEHVKSYVEYVFDTQKKMKIIGRSSTGDILFEFGQGHNQQFFLYPSENDFYIAVFDNNDKSLIAIIEQRDLEATVFYGDIKKSNNIEFFRLYIIPMGIENSNGEYTQDLDANKKNLTNLMSNILSAFPEDKDGDRWMLCK